MDVEAVLLAAERGKERRPRLMEMMVLLGHSTKDVVIGWIG